MTASNEHGLTEGTVILTDTPEVTVGEPFDEDESDVVVESPEDGLPTSEGLIDTCYALSPSGCDPADESE